MLSGVLQRRGSDCGREHRPARTGSVDPRRRKRPAWGLRRGRSLGAATPALPTPHPPLLLSFHAHAQPPAQGGGQEPRSSLRNTAGRRAPSVAVGELCALGVLGGTPSQQRDDLSGVTLGSHRSDRPPQERWPGLHVLELSAHEPSSAVPHDDRSCGAWPGPRLE